VSKRGIAIFFAKNFHSVAFCHLNTLPLPKITARKGIKKIKNMKTTQKYTGIDLINKVMEFLSLVPNTNDWFLDKLKKNPPRYMLLQQILALMDAFEIVPSDDISWKEFDSYSYYEFGKHFGKVKQILKTAKGERRRLSHFLASTFMFKKTPDDYADFMSILKEYECDVFDAGQMTGNYNKGIYGMFSRLLAFKKNLYDVSMFNSCFLAASGFIRFSIRLTNATFSSIDTSDLDRVLECFVNPRKLSFTEEELITKYQFPSTEEYRKILIDWL
jgi:hypothetical protein